MALLKGEMLDAQADEHSQRRSQDRNGVTIGNCIPIVENFPTCFEGAPGVKRDKLKDY